MNDAHVFSNVFSTLFDALNAISNCFLTTTTLGVANNRLSLGIKRESIEPYYKTYTDLSLDDIMFFYLNV